MYLPDAIDSYHVGGTTYLVMANEGDTRDYPGFNEEIRVGAGGYVLDPAVFPNASTLKLDANLGRLTATSNAGREGKRFGYAIRANFCARGSLFFHS
jgi:hypothetical protein